MAWRQPQWQPEWGNARWADGGGWWTAADGGDWWPDGNWTDWRGGKGKGQGCGGPPTDPAKGKGQGQARARGKGKGQGCGGQSPPTDAGGPSKGQGAACPSDGGEGQGAACPSDGGKGKHPFDGATGQEWLRAKGKATIRNYQAAQKAPAKTEAGRRRQQRSEHYVAQRASGGMCPEAEPEETPHVMQIPWPHSFAELGGEFMSHWQKEGNERGFNLRLSTWRNSHWKESPETCASMYRLRLTQKDKRPDTEGAAQLFFEFASAAVEHAQTTGLTGATLPWHELIEWWDGQVDDGAHTVEFSRLQDGQDTRVVIDRSGKVAAVRAIVDGVSPTQDDIGGVSPTATQDAVNIQGSVDPHKRSRARHWANFSGPQKHRARSISRRRSRRAASAPTPARHVPPADGQPPMPPQPHVVPPRAFKTPPTGAASPLVAAAPKRPPKAPPKAPPVAWVAFDAALTAQQQHLQPKSPPPQARAPKAPPQAEASPCATVPALSQMQQPRNRSREPPPTLPAASSSGLVPAQEDGPQCQASGAQPWPSWAWKTLTTEALRCAERIKAEDSGVGLPENWMQRIQAAIDKGPDAKATWMDPTACPRIVLCIPTFKRTWQLTQTLPINLVLAWEMRDHCIFVVADLNEELSEDMSRLFQTCGVATQQQMLRHYRRLVPEEDGFTHWHASIGKNTAHVCGCDACPTNCLLVALDNDNFVSQTFFEDIYEKSGGLMDGNLAGIKWRHPKAPPCTGRIGGLSPGCQHAGASSNFVSRFMCVVSVKYVAIVFPLCVSSFFVQGGPQDKVSKSQRELSRIEF